METKVCKSCGKELPLEDFPKNKGCKDGHTNFCKICTREKRRTRLGTSIEVLQTEGMNICPVCKRELPIIEFAEDAKLVENGYVKRAILNILLLIKVEIRIISENFD